jgi:arylamine N-acetyltransferase
MSLSQRPTYTRSQLSRWLNLINQTKTQIVLEDIEAEVKQYPLDTLAKIQLWQLAAVPFGNLVLHYSPHHTVSLDSETLFTKIVERGSGGYCMENNAFFATVLRALGYNLYTTGARVSNALDKGNKDPGGYGGWSHMLIIVTVCGRKYMVDVGFGASGAIQPVLLEVGEIVQNVPTSQGRLVYRPMAENTDSSQRLWIFEVQNSPESSWVPQYCFTEVEFLPQDFSVMNLSTSQSRTSWFTQKFVLTKVILDKEQKVAVGTLILFHDELKQRLNGRSDTLAICRTEEQRVKVLEEHFGVKLCPDEIRGIQGLPSEIIQPWKGS